jgi:uncharacterized protein
MNATWGELKRKCPYSDAAKRRLLSVIGEPLFFSDWSRAVFIHYEVDPEVLQPFVPFPLDLRDGKAYVSLVAFTMRGLRPRLGGLVGEFLFRPIATHGLLNVRTYVNHQGEQGIYFISEWIPNRLSAFIGPRTFGLPYRLGKLEYRHHHETGELNGTVTTGPHQLVYSAYIDPATPLHVCATDSLEEFLMERYTAFTSSDSKRRFFRIWHPPWLQTSIDAKVLDDSLLQANFPWFRHARRIGAYYSPGVENVWMGRPHAIQENQQSTDLRLTAAAVDRLGLHRA